MSDSVTGGDIATVTPQALGLPPVPPIPDPPPPAPVAPPPAPAAPASTGAGIDPAARPMLFELGVGIALALRSIKRLPETQAARLGMDEAKFDRILAGRELDVSLQMLLELAKDVSGNFGVVFNGPQQRP